MRRRRTRRLRSRARAAAVCLCALLLAVTAGGSAADEAAPPARVEAGRALYTQNCSPSHGARMADPQGAFDLRTFPHEQHDRFVSSVRNGKNNMPPWGDLLTAEDIESLWAYVTAGERK